MSQNREDSQGLLHHQRNPFLDHSLADDEVSTLSTVSSRFRNSISDDRQVSPQDHELSMLNRDFDQAPPPPTTSHGPGLPGLDGDEFGLSHPRGFPSGGSSNYEAEREEQESNDSGRSTPTLKNHGASAKGIEDTEAPVDRYDDEIFKQRYSEPPHYCASREDIRRKTTSIPTIIIFLLSLYSTIMSGIWLVVSILQPRWGHQISSRIGLVPSTATLLTALGAKTIELSFVTIFITTIGQILTRRSFVRGNRGVTMAEMAMRQWVLQPGSLITHYDTLPYASLTFLGVLSLLATIAASFYTTASDAMVAPKLKYGNWEHTLLSGYVRASFSNAEYLGQSCPSLLGDVDPDEGPGSCMNVQFSGQSYRNLLSFMNTWRDIRTNGTGVYDQLSERPSGTTLLYDNTTMKATWIETEHSDIKTAYGKTGRIINNVTMAMPHPGVYSAATNDLNGILQPDDLAGVGEYAIRAGVVSPAVNVMCVNMDKYELKPLVYTTWDGATVNKTGVGDQTVGWTGWEADVPNAVDSDGKANYLNSTAVDDIFQWGAKYERRPPVFQLYPSDYNVVSNATVYMGDAIYILTKAPVMKNYTLCELRSWVSPLCSTRFNISGTIGASMEAHCEDDNDPDSYLKSFDKGDQPSTGVASMDWKWIAQEWSLSMDLNSGTFNANASNGRILSQLALTQPAYPATLPSIAEALAAYVSSTIVLSTIDTPFIHYWNYSSPMLAPPGTIQHFNGSMITQQYTSGHVNDWQNIFYPILALVFAINLFCMFYLVLRPRLVTDFIDPQNGFSLAINSPPSKQIMGSCGAGPSGRDLVVPWRVAYAPSADHYFWEEAKATPWRGKYAGLAPGGGGASSSVDMVNSGNGVRLMMANRGRSYQRLSEGHKWHI